MNLIVHAHEVNKGQVQKFETTFKLSCIGLQDIFKEALTLC